MATKKEIAENISKQLNLPRKKVVDTINLIFEIVIKELENNRKVTFRGFGTFELKETKQREIIHPKSKEMIVVGGNKIVKFKSNINLGGKDDPGL